MITFYFSYINMIKDGWRVFSAVGPMPGPEAIKPCDSNDTKLKLSGSLYLSILTRRIQPATGMGGKRKHT